MPTLEELVSHPPQLPVTRALADIAAAARPGACAVVTAPPGTGKTTLLPPAVAVALAGYEASAGRVLVTQPRRVAARAAAAGSLVCWARRWGARSVTRCAGIRG